MTVIKDFALPDLGEGLTESELVNWHVAVGDTVRLNQIIAEVETAKALVELPAPWSGVVSALYVEPGVTVSVGDRIVAFEVEGEPAPDAAPRDSTPSEDAPAGTTPGRVEQSDDRAADVPEPNLVGYGARAESRQRPARRARPGLTTTTDVLRRAEAPAQPERRAQERPRATPPLRMLARERGIDLDRVTGTGDGGLITRSDIDAFPHEAQPQTGQQPTAQQQTVQQRAAQQGDTRIPIRGVRKLTAEAMVRSAFTAPHATVFLTIDVTPTSELLERLRRQNEFAESRPGLLSVVAKALMLAVRRTPAVNAHWDEEAQEIIEFGSVTLGIAAATPRGLMVPTIAGADRLTLAELATAIRSLAETARAGRTPPGRLTGGTITITNVGVFGVDAGTPILTPGEAAILALGAVRRQPWEYHGEIALRDVVTLALSFDHRVVDGEGAARFLADIGRILADPAAALAMV